MQTGPARDPTAVEAEPWQRLPTAGWYDLVLPEPVVAQLKGAAAQFSQRPETAAGDTRGMLLLFTGSRGTGKTLAAQAIAGELRRPVLEAELESFFSRSRGEAAQLVARLFEAARQLGAVLSLDGVDAVLNPGLGRSALTDADARDVLRRAEAHPSVTVFASTVRQDIAPSARDRFAQVVAFPFPEQPARAQLWRRALPTSSALPTELIGFLADAFQLPGKAIAQCGTRARNAAAADRSAVDLRHIAAALDQEYSQRLTGEATRASLSELRRRAAASARHPSAPNAPHPNAPLPSAPVSPVSTTPAGEPRTALPPASATTAAGVPVAGMSSPISPRSEAAVPEAGTPLAGSATAGAPVAAHQRRPAELPGSPTTAVPGGQLPGERSSIRLALGSRRLLPVAVIGAIAAIVLGLAAAQPRSRSMRPTALDRSAAAGPLRVSYPSSWRPGTAPAVSGLPLAQALELSSKAPSGSLIVGTTSAPGTSPLPTRFVTLSIPGRPAPQLVTLGNHRFYRVIDPRLALGASSQSVYALPVGASTVVALCHTASASFAAACERVLATLQVSAIPSPTTPSAPAPIPDAAYARSLSTVLAQLNRGRSSDARALLAARDSTAQAKAASALATAHARAAGAVAALKAGSVSPANAALAAALRETSGAYSALAHAAARNDKRGYGAAQAAVARANGALSSALKQLQLLGYKLS